MNRRTVKQIALLLLLGALALGQNVLAADEAKPGTEGKPAAGAKPPSDKPPANGAKPAGGPPGGRRGPRASPVKVATAQRMTLAPQTWVAGTVISRDEVQLAAEVAGKLLKVAQVGDTLRAGEVLAEIDATFVQLKIEEYQAAVLSEEANLNFLDSELNRLTRLARQNNAAQTRLEEVRANRAVANSKLQIAKTRVRQAEEELRRHTLHAPFAGVVVERYLRPGEHAKVGDDLLRLMDVQSLEVQARIPLQTRDYVAAGQAITIQSGEKTDEGRVRTLVAAGDERSRLLELRLTLPAGAWTIGQPVRIAIPTDVAQQVLAVPRDALVLRRDGAKVFVVGEDNKALPVAVEVGVAIGPYMGVTGQLKPGDRVVIRGGERLRPGADVKVLPDGPAGAKANGKSDSKPQIKRDGAPAANNG